MLTAFENGLAYGRESQTTCGDMELLSGDML